MSRPEGPSVPGAASPSAWQRPPGGQDIEGVLSHVIPECMGNEGCILGAWLGQQAE